MRRRWRCRRSHALPSVRVSLARGEADDVSLAPPQTATPMPPDAQTDRSACSAFIDDCRNKMPPTDKQVALAPGDVITTTIEGIGTMTNTCV